MSHSNDQRLENVHFALKLIVQQVGEGFFSNHLINTEMLEGVYPTTWSDMRDHYRYIHNVTGFQHLFKLNASGWVEALRLEGVLDKPELKAELGLICKYLKDQVKGRDGDVTINLQDVATATNISIGEIANIIEARLIESQLGRYGATLVKAFSGGLITIPANFGLTLPK